MMKQIFFTLLIIAVGAVGVLYPKYNAQPVGADSDLLIGGKVYSLNQSVSSSQNTIELASFTLPVSGDKVNSSHIGDIEYGTIEPGNEDRQEFVSFTGVTQNADGTATLTGVSRGLAPVDPYTASSTYQVSHAGGSRFIVTDPPAKWAEVAFKDNDETVGGTWTFSSTSQPRYDGVSSLTGNDQFFASVRYVNNAANQGAATSSETIAGISELATVIETASSTQFDANNPHVINSENATSSPTFSCDSSGTSGALCIPVAQNDGKLTQAWYDLTEAFSVSGLWTFTSGLFTTASSTMNATTTIAASDVNNKAFVLNGMKTAWPSSQPASSTVPFVDATGKITFGNFVASTTPAATTTADKLFRALNEQTHTGDTAFSLEKAFSMKIGGGVRVNLWIKNNGSTTNYEIRDHNDNVLASGSTSNTTYTQFTDDVIVSAGDRLEVYISTDAGGNVASIKDVEVSYDKVYTDDVSIELN